MTNEIFSKIYAFFIEGVLAGGIGIYLLLKIRLYFQTTLILDNADSDTLRLKLYFRSGFFAFLGISKAIDLKIEVKDSNNEDFEFVTFILLDEHLILKEYNEEDNSTHIVKRFKTDKRFIRVRITYTIEMTGTRKCFEQILPNPKA